MFPALEIPGGAVDNDRAAWCDHCFPRMGFTVIRSGPRRCLSREG